MEHLTVSSVVEKIAKTQEAETGDPITDYTEQVAYTAIRALVDQEVAAALKKKADESNHP